MTSNGSDKKQVLMGEFNSDINIDRMNLADKVFLIPSIKAKWIGIYAAYRDELDKYNTTLAVLRANQRKLERNKLKVAVSDEELAKLKFKNTKDIEDLENTIADHGALLDLLGDLKKSVSFLGNDVRNITEYLKLELL